MKLTTDIHRRADLVNQRMDSKSHNESSAYNTQQLGLMFTEENVTRLTKELGHAPSDLEVVQDWIQSGRAAEYSQKNNRE